MSLRKNAKDKESTIARNFSFQFQTNKKLDENLNVNDNNYNKPQETELNSCQCEVHEGKECLNKVFDLSIDYMFGCIFEDSEIFGRYLQLTKKYGTNFNYQL